MKYFYTTVKNVNVETCNLFNVVVTYFTLETLCACLLFFTDFVREKTLTSVKVLALYDAFFFESSGFYTGKIVPALVTNILAQKKD